MNESYTVKDSTNPRASVVENGLYESGIQITIGRNGVEVFAYYDTMVGITPLFISWENFDALRKRAMMPLKKEKKNA